MRPWQHFVSVFQAEILTHLEMSLLSGTRGQPVRTCGSNLLGRFGYDFCWFEHPVCSSAGSLVRPSVRTAGSPAQPAGLPVRSIPVHRVWLAGSLIRPTNSAVGFDGFYRFNLQFSFSVALLEPAGLNSSSRVRRPVRQRALLRYFEVRKEARTSEIDALGKAKAVLSGADYSLVQTSSRRFLRRA